MSNKDYLFGSLKDGLPWSEPNWYDSRNYSPYYNDSHRAWRGVVRNFVDTEIMPYRDEWDETGKIPDELFIKAGKIGLLSAAVGWPDISPIPRPEGYTVFHSFIAMDELCRCGSGGIVWCLIGGSGIGLSPIIYFGTDEQKEFAKQVLTGHKKVCLAVSEPLHGSDVAGLTTTGREEGDHYVVNGQKKWITGRLHTFTHFKSKTTHN
jgi:alkylation response protein AidB-like acyl-CoA dehydrogenase